MQTQTTIDTTALTTIDPTADADAPLRSKHQSSSHSYPPLTMKEKIFSSDLVKDKEGGFGPKTLRETMTRATLEDIYTRHEDIPKLICVVTMIEQNEQEFLRFKGFPWESRQNLPEGSVTMRETKDIAHRSHSLVLKHEFTQLRRGRDKTIDYFINEIVWNAQQELRDICKSMRCSIPEIAQKKNMCRKPFTGKRKHDGLASTNFPAREDTKASSTSIKKRRTFIEDAPEPIPDDFLVSEPLLFGVPLDNTPQEEVSLGTISITDSADLSEVADLDSFDPLIFLDCPKPAEDRCKIDADSLVNVINSTEPPLPIDEMSLHEKMDLDSLSLSDEPDLLACLDSPKTSVVNHFQCEEHKELPELAAVDVSDLIDSTESSADFADELPLSSNDEYLGNDKDLVEEGNLGCS